MQLLLARSSGYQVKTSSSSTFASSQWRIPVSGTTLGAAVPAVSDANSLCWISECSSPDAACPSWATSFLPSAVPQSLCPAIHTLHTVICCLASTSDMHCPCWTQASSLWWQCLRAVVGNLSSPSLLSQGTCLLMPLQEFYDPYLFLVHPWSGGRCFHCEEPAPCAMRHLLSHQLLKESESVHQFWDTSRTRTARIFTAESKEYMRSVR